jgi:hypothetical protein
MTGTLIEALLRRVRDEPGNVPPPMSSTAIDAAERVLGFALPALLKTIYQTIGDGGFGPGRGLLSLALEDPGDGRESAVALYRHQRALIARDGASADMENLGDGALVMDWPERLVPICTWGSGVYSCVDCGSEHAPIVRFDPGQFWDEGETAEECYRTVLLPESPGLALWLGSWLGGSDLRAAPDTTRSPRVTRRRGPRRSTMLGFAAAVIAVLVVVYHMRLLAPEVEYHLRAVPCSSANAASMALARTVEANRVAQLASYLGQSLTVRSSFQGCDLTITIVGPSKIQPPTLFTIHGSLTVYGMGKLPAPSIGDAFATQRVPPCTPEHDPAPCLIFTGADMVPGTLQAGNNFDGQSFGDFTVNDPAAGRLSDYTSTHIDNPIVIALDDKVVVSTNIMGAISSGNMQLTGLGNLAQSDTYLASYADGELPFPVTVVSVGERLGVPILGF